MRSSRVVHCKKRLTVFPSPAVMSLTKLSLDVKKFNYSRPGRVWLVTSRHGTGKQLIFFKVEERLTANAPSCQSLGSIPASSDTVEPEGPADEAVLNTVHRKKENTKKSPVNKYHNSYY